MRGFLCTTLSMAFIHSHQYCLSEPRTFCNEEGNPTTERAEPKIAPEFHGMDFLRLAHSFLVRLHDNHEQNHFILYRFNLFHKWMQTQEAINKESIVKTNSWIQFTGQFLDSQTTIPLGCIGGCFTFILSDLILASKCMMLR